MKNETCFGLTKDEAKKITNKTFFALCFLMCCVMGIVLAIMLIAPIIIKIVCLIFAAISFFGVFYLLKLNSFANS